MNNFYQMFQELKVEYSIATDERVLELEKLLENIDTTKTKADKPPVTESGAAILKYFQSSGQSDLSSKQIAEAMSTDARRISGAVRKLTTDGFLDKSGKDPVVYSLTEKGKNYKENN